MVVEGATCEFLPKATIDSRIGTAFIHTSNLYNHRLHKLVAHTAAPLGQAGGFSEETHNFATHNIHSGATFCSTDLESSAKTAWKWFKGATVSAVNFENKFLGK